VTNQYRKHNCGTLNKSNLNQNIKLSGWIHSKRDHGGLIFIDLRDHYGITQIVIDSENKNLNLELIASIKLESVITIDGEVILRSLDAINSKINTGEIEIKVNNFVKLKLR
jgi:aspartyl-tRNA synthetase